MAEILDPAMIEEYHVHVYFEKDTPSATTAQALRDAIGQQFGDRVEIGRWHEKPVGPHPVGSYQVKFKPEDFRDIVQWLSLNSNGLSVLIHPETGDELKDHRDRPLWLGKQLALKLDIFQPRQAPANHNRQP